MNRNLPPFPAVRAFEAAARHLSFKGAADELNVTQSAISHQVKALETYLGISLFRRTTGGVDLTEAGESYLPVLSEALDSIADGTVRLRGDDTGGPLAVSTTPAFAARWLVPRLGAFCEAHPEIEVRIASSRRGSDFFRDDVDVAVRYGRGRWPDLRADCVLRSPLVAVCSPKLLEGRHPLRAPGDLCHHRLLHGDQGEAWTRWLLAARAEGVDPARGPRFDDCNLMLQAAAEGQGVALAFRALVAEDLAARRLVQVFDVSAAPEVGYYVVCPETWAGRAKIAAFRDWLLAEAARDAGTAEAGDVRVVALSPAE